MFKLPTTNAFSKYVLCIYSVLLKRLSPQQLRCCLPFLYIHFIKIKNVPQLCKMTPSSFPSLLFTHQEQLEILPPSIHCQIFQAARKLPKRGKEMN